MFLAPAVLMTWNYFIKENTPEIIESLRIAYAVMTVALAVTYALIWTRVNSKPDETIVKVQTKVMSGELAGQEITEEITHTEHDLREGISLSLSLSLLDLLIIMI